VVRGNPIGHRGGGTDRHHRAGSRLDQYHQSGALDAGDHPDHDGAATGGDDTGTDLPTGHLTSRHQPSAHQSPDDGASAGDDHSDHHGLRVLT
jgi:hypothetical protein